MFEIKIEIDDQYHKTIEFAKPLSVEELLNDLTLSKGCVIACKTNTEFLNRSFLLEKDNKINLVTTRSYLGQQIYKNTSIYILCKAFHKIYPNEEIVIEHSIGYGVYAEKISYTFKLEDVEKIKKEFQLIVDAAMPIEKRLISRQQAMQKAKDLKRKDILKNVRYHDMTFYKCGDYEDYTVGEVAYNTKLIEAFDLHYKSPGFILRFPMKSEMKLSQKIIIPNKIFSTHQEHDKWLNILKLHNVSALNEAVRNYKVKDLIQIEEALHEKKIVNIAQDIADSKSLKLILISGPTSSGKTTFSQRLSIQLNVQEIRPKVISMDDYFLPRSETPKKSNGEFDFETIKALDIALLNNNLNKLLSGEEVEPPKYDFVTGTRQRSYEKITLAENEIIILEGIHGLNEELTQSIPFNQKLKIYVSSLNNLNIDAHNRISTTDSRLFRRIVRDHKYRGHSPDITLQMWKSVREGEDQNIFPFQENADYVFNSSLTYELAVLKKHLLPLLKGISTFSPGYLESLRLFNILEHFYNVQDEFVPSNSILREFIGASIFDY